MPDTKKIATPLFHTLLVTLISAFLISCGGSSSSDSNGDSGADGGDNSGDGGGSGSLRFTILDDTDTRNPLEGAVVSVYEDDNKTILQTITTGADGVADFGSSASGNAALRRSGGRFSASIAYEGPDELLIQTEIDLPEDNYVLFMLDTGCVPQGQISASYDSISADVSALLEPFFSGDNDPLTGGGASAQVSGGSAEFTDLTVCKEDLQSDGKLTHIASVFDDTGTMLSYGFKTDEIFTDGAVFSTAPANTTPDTTSWTATAEPPDGIVVGALRKGVSYSLAFSANQEEASSGTFLTPNQFPADTWRVLASHGGLDNSDDQCGTSRPYSSLPASLDISIPDFGVTDFTYNATTQTFEFTITSSDPRDAIEISTMFEGPKPVQWNINLPPNSTTFTFPDLADSIAAKFNRADIEDDDSQLTVLNTNLDSYDALANFTNSSDSIETLEFDICAYELTAESSGGDDSGGGGDDGGGDDGGDDNSGAGGGDVGFSGTGAFNPPSATSPGTSFTSTNYEELKFQETLINMTWEDSNGTVIAVFPNAQDASKAAQVSITLDGNVGGAAWLAADTDGIVDGVTITDNSVSFSDVSVIDDATPPSTIMMTGTLARQ